ncbi:MAG TPA: hypothetical protein VGE72_04460 [Azospirillum sp.]
MTSASSAPSGVAKLKQMLMSEAIPVTPIRPIPGEGQPQGRRRDEVEETEDAVRRGGRASGSDAGTTARGAGTAGGGAAGTNGGESGPVTPGPVSLGAGPMVGFVTQSIAQEAVGPGLHIEPWPEAIQAYRRADAGLVNEPLVSRVTV